MDDPYQLLGVRPDAPPDEIRAAYRRLVRLHHPDRHGTDDASARTARHERIASITAAYRMLNDPNELERFRRLQQRRDQARNTSEPGRNGVHFTAANPATGGTIEPAPGDPDFDYRQRAPSEFTVRRDPIEPIPWTARPPTRRRRWPRGS